MKAALVIGLSLVALAAIAPVANATHNSGSCSGWIMGNASCYGLWNGKERCLGVYDHNHDPSNNDGTGWCNGLLLPNAY